MQRLFIIMAFGLAMVASCGEAGGPADVTPSVSATSTTSSAASTPTSSSDCIPPNLSRNAKDRSDLVGQSPDVAATAEKNAGHTIRILGTDGDCADTTDDFNSNRVNLVVRGGKISWAAMY